VTRSRRPNSFQDKKKDYRGPNISWCGIENASRNVDDKLFIAFPEGRVYTGLDELHSSLKGIVRSRNLLMEVKVSRREQPPVRL
jgi:hypothetical protein